MEYFELVVDIDPREPYAEILVAELAENGFESFMDTETGILAYGQVGEINMDNPLMNTSLDEIPEGVKLTWNGKIIPQQNWNALWEADFKPVEVENYVIIHAPFHEIEDFTGMKVEILPKMSFGTGHHQTTWMMTKALFELSEIPDRVLDMGTGTGVLAIVAEKLGAKEIVAVDIEDWSVENTMENAERNACNKITALCGDIDIVKDQKFGLILANINKNVLKSHLPFYAEMLDAKGILMLSGFFDTDVNELLELAEKVGFSNNKILNKDNWAAIELKKK